MSFHCYFISDHSAERVLIFKRGGYGFFRDFLKEKVARGGQLLRTCGAAVAPVALAYFAQHDFERMDNRQRIPWGSKMDCCKKRK